MIDGNFVGLGVELKLDDQAGGLLLVNVLKGGPAFEAGIQPGDRILEVDGTPLAGLDLDAAANKLQGVEGSEVVIKVQSAATGAMRGYRLVRRPVEVQSVSVARLVDPAAGIGYIQLTGFQKTSTVELQAAIADLERQGMRYLVLDLRGNPGGLLNISVEIADRFLAGGQIVSTRGRAPGQSQVYRATGRPLWRMPLAVLVDHDSASASEILAGALQDNHRAVVIGERSYGKGSVQSIFPLRAATAGLKLTTAKFYSPTDRAYSEQGVTPDTVVRTAARPKGETDPNDLPALNFGKPERDPVLRAAIELARRGSGRRAG
jgi:carboxyl-terminal processing protease